MFQIPNRRRAIVRKVIAARTVRALRRMSPRSATRRLHHAQADHFLSSIRKAKEMRQFGKATSRRKPLSAALKWILLARSRQNKLWARRKSNRRRASNDDTPTKRASARGPPPCVGLQRSLQPELCGRCMRSLVSNIFFVHESVVARTSRGIDGSLTFRAFGAFSVIAGGVYPEIE